MTIHCCVMRATNLPNPTDRTFDAPRPTRPRRAAECRVRTTLVAVMLAMTTQVGCQNADPTNPLGGIFDPLFPPSPGEVAREAVDPGDPDARRRSVALLQAAPFGGAEPYVNLYRLLIDDPDPTVRAACIRALGLHGDPSDAPAIVRQLDHELPIVRWEAAKALQKLHHPDAVEPLIAHLANDVDDDVRLASARALGQYPQSQVIQALIGALRDRSYGVVHAARESLVTLTGQEQLGADSAEWLQWTDQNSESLFAQRQQYTWAPFHRPPNFLDHVQFWKDHDPKAPRPPRGLDELTPEG